VWLSRFVFWFVIDVATFPIFNCQDIQDGEVSSWTLALEDGKDF
jgi:hypothetical protein